MTTDVKPLPCPFCGGAARTWHCEAKPTIDGWRFGWRAGCLNPECDTHPYTHTLWGTRQEAIAAWNRRPSASTSAATCSDEAMIPDDGGGKRRSCELPAGHDDDHRAHYGGQPVSWLATLPGQQRQTGRRQAQRNKTREMERE